MLTIRTCFDLGLDNEELQEVIDTLLAQKILGQVDRRYVLDAKYSEAIKTYEDELRDGFEKLSKDCAPFVQP